MPLELQLSDTFHSLQASLMYTAIHTKLGYNQTYVIVNELRELGFKSDVTSDGLRVKHPRCMWSLLRDTVETIPGLTLHPFLDSRRVSTTNR